MAYLDGINFSTDQVSGFDEPPLEFNASEWGDRNILTSMGEYPRARKIGSPDITGTVADVPLKKKLVEPPTEWFSNMASGIMGWEPVIVILLVLIVALQIRSLMRGPVILYALPPSAPAVQPLPNAQSTAAV